VKYGLKLVAVTKKYPQAIHGTGVTLTVLSEVAGLNIA
jgi:hypothetical protein